MCHKMQVVDIVWRYIQCIWYVHIQCIWYVRRMSHVMCHMTLSHTGTYSVYGIYGIYGIYRVYGI